MSSKTKIVVFKFRELVYTAIFAGLAILLIILLILMFFPKKEEPVPETGASESVYVPGVYATAVRLSDQTLNLVVCLDADHINRIYLENLEETVETLYPLVPSVLQSLSSQILSTQSPESVTYNTSSQYTAELLLSAIRESIDRAKAVS